MAIASETDGSVAVFVLGSATHLWEPYGDVFTYGVTNRDDAKASVSLSYFGETLAIAIPSEGAFKSDSVRVVGYDDEQEKWVPIGKDIHLDASARIQRGGSVSLSRNGTVLAVGSWAGGDGSSSYSSHAEVYHFFNNTWQQLGNEKIGSRIHKNGSEASVSLSGNGSILAIGSGSISRVFQYNEAKDRWSQLGQDLVGRAVSLTEDGKVIAVGNPATLEGAGETIVYVYDEDGQWTQIGMKILGKSARDAFGAALALSEDGKRVIDNA
jgi:hypothetical protein